VSSAEALRLEKPYIQVIPVVEVEVVKVAKAFMPEATVKVDTQIA
jgi:hypothetical protein